jgi:hypothetical protein
MNTINVILVVEFQVVPKKQDTWPKINIFEGIDCVFCEYVQ